MAKIILFFFFPFYCFGQNKFEFGLVSSAQIKINTLGKNYGKNSVFGTIGAGFFFKINNADNTFSYIQSLGINYDKITYHVDKGNKIQIENLLIDINPSVTLTSKWDNISYILGFGGVIVVDNVIGFSTNSHSTGNFYSNVDSMGAILTENNRNLIPYITLGLSYKIHPYFNFQIFANQFVLDYYMNNTMVSYTKDQTLHEIDVRYQPLGIGIRILFIL